MKRGALTCLFLGATGHKTPFFVTNLQSSWFVAPRLCFLIRSFYRFLNPSLTPSFHLFLGLPLLLLWPGSPTFLGTLLSPKLHICFNHLIYSLFIYVVMSGLWYSSYTSICVLILQVSFCLTPKIFLKIFLVTLRPLSLRFLVLSLLLGALLFYK